MSPPRVVRTSLALSLVAAAACSDSRNPTQPDTGPNPSPPQPQMQDASFDSDALARAIPGFGGFFIDAAGVPTVRLTNPAGRAAAERALQPMLRSLDVGPALKVIQADYTAQQLDAWVQRASSAVLNLRGVVFIDNDEARNRVTVAVESRAAEPAVRAAMQRLGIQREAVTVELSGPVHTAATLRDKVRPVVGGLQIYWTKGSSAFVCTLGFNVINPPDPRRSFLTNSHCTRTRGNVLSPTPYSQPLSPSSIGREVEDPPFFTSPPCPSGRKCRRSDAARAIYNSTTTSLLGRLARTALGSITISGQSIITSEGSPVVGATLNKVGRTTGTSSGKVTNTCITVNVFPEPGDPNVTMICQDIVKANSGPGDSGSPVFAITRSNVRLNGILWGGAVIGGVPHFVFSRMTNIESEMGPMTTF